MAELPQTPHRVSLETLRQQYPWPDNRPDFAPVQWSLDGGGRWLVQEKLRRPEFNLVLEIGSFLGGSIHDWLSVSPDIHVVAVDPWPETCGVAQYAREQGKGEEVAKQLERPDGFYQTFLANFWELRDRVIPVRGYSPAVLHELAELRLRPDLIYLDSDKVGGEIELCHKLFPGAVMTGDDWGWKGESGDFPIRQPVTDFCETRNRFLKVEGATWVIDTEPPSVRFRFRSWRRSLKTKMKTRRRAA